jgi:hypothetical protein
VTHRAEGPGVETWRHSTAGRPASRAVAGKTTGGDGGDSGGDKVETEWRHQTLSTSYPPFGFPGPALAAPKPAGCADARTAGLLLAVPCLESAFCGAKDSAARAATRPAALALAGLVGRDPADKVARAVRGVAVWPELAELPEGGSDWNDAARHAGADLVRDRIEAAIRAAAAAQPAPKPKAPAGRTSPARAAGQPNAAPKPQRPPAGRDARAGTNHSGILVDAARHTWPSGACVSTKHRLHD